MKLSNLKRAVLLPTSPFVPRTSIQPFFTTKPTGQGTELGLSLCYDIEKAHGGELRLETKHIEGFPAESAAAEQAGSEFIIQLKGNKLQ